MSALLFFFLSCAGRGQMVTKCDGTKVLVPTDCGAVYGPMIQERSAEAGLSISHLETTVGASAGLNKKLSAISQEMDQLSIQYRDTMVGLCQSQQADPCDAEVQADVRRVREEMGQRFGDLRTELAAIQAQVDAGASESDLSSSLDSTLAGLKGEEAAVESEEGTEGEAPAAEPAAAPDVPAEGEPSQPEAEGSAPVIDDKTPKMGPASEPGLPR